MNGRVTAEWHQPGPDWTSLSFAGVRFRDVGLLLTVAFVFLTIISPDQFGVEWANYHVLTFLGGFILLISLPGLFATAHWRSQMQILLLLGFSVAVGFSQIANGWFGGAILSWKVFLPSVGVFFFIVANATTARALKILTLAIVASCLVVVVESLWAYYFGFRGDTFLLSQTLFSKQVVVGEFVRIRGAGFLSDPNDFAQILLIALPLTSFAWRPGRFLQNSLLVYAPAVLLLWAIYLTHSRGALVAIVVMAWMLSRNKMGRTASVVVTILLGAGLLTLNFTGGRMISADAGADRLWLWASGLEMFKKSPFFGVGFGRFADFADITAHNSFILCLGELGLVGSTLWVALHVSTLLGLNRIIRSHENTESLLSSAADRAGKEEVSLPKQLAPAMATHTAISRAPIVAEDAQPVSGPALESAMPTRWVVAMRLAMISFLATSWFLSRAYQSTAYLVLGLATATIAVYRNCDESPARIRWVSYTLAVEALAILLVYEVVRLRF